MPFCVQTRSSHQTCPAWSEAPGAYLSAGRFGARAYSGGWSQLDGQADRAKGSVERVQAMSSRAQEAKVRGCTGSTARARCATPRHQSLVPVHPRSTARRSKTCGSLCPPPRRYRPLALPASYPAQQLAETIPDVTCDTAPCVGLDTTIPCTRADRLLDKAWTIEDRTETSAL